MPNRFMRTLLNRWLGGLRPFPYLRANVLEVRTYAHLKHAMGWSADPVLVGEHLGAFDYLEDLNDRRLRDAEVIGGTCCNGNPKILLEIGTGLGKTTVIMARNAPEATVYTVNIPPEEIDGGGKAVTFAPSREEIGQCHKTSGLTNVVQILANTKRWSPDFGPIDVAYIDGCHDADYVYNDTRKVLKRAQPGSLILWHDFAPELTDVYSWIREVCIGVERLFEKRLLSGRVLHLADSWVGLYRVPGEPGPGAIAS
jgi:predicted O-methyltransferase YrrM